MKTLRLVVPVLISIFVIQQAAAEALAHQGSAAPQGQSVTQAMRSEANDFYQRQDWANAVKAYEAITRLEPQNAAAWSRLGAALHFMSKYERAAEAYKRSNEISANATTMYNLACAYARLNDKGRALEWLDKAVQAGFSQPQTLSTDEDLASLRNEAKFKELVSRAQANATPCASRAVHRQFDFWVGEWNVENPQGQRAGTSSVQLILGDCVVFENWTGAGGGSGKSFNFYNSNTGKWQQTWVDNVGGVLEFSGEFKDGAMRYSAESVAQNGSKTLHRLTFFNLAPGRVRQFWEQSTDGGKTWTAAFDGTYIKKQ
jgi:tetratricopeptide (TPR) repeat protein